MVFSKRRIVAKNEKRITIGTITARFSRNENRSRNKSSEDEWVIEVNGKLMVVDKKTFGYYHKRDLAEFHYLDSGIILRHKLLKRGEKEYF